MTKRWGNAGFTIVELLIVIVVIAILAAITIIAYNGIQQRSRSAVVTNAVQTWEQAITRANIEGTSLTGETFSCLGNADDFPASDGFIAGQCAQLNDEQILYDQTLFSNWPTTVSRANGKLPVTTLSNPILTVRARGIWVYHDQPNQSIQMTWVVQTKGDCGSGSLGATGSGSFGGSMCTKTIKY